MFRDRENTPGAVSEAAAQPTTANADQSHHTLRVAVLGGPATYSWQAARQHFAGRDGVLSAVIADGFEKLIAAVEEGAADCAVLPIENTTSGGINEVYDLLPDSAVTIVGEELLAVQHCLAARAKIEPSQLIAVAGHAQALTQCRRFLAELPGCRLEYRSSTEQAVAMVAGQMDSRLACIVGAEAAAAAGLTVIRRDIADRQPNTTRFVIVARQPREVALPLPCKISLVMVTTQQVGSLAEALLVFRDRRINLCKLESRPAPSSCWEQLFYLDLEGNIADENVAAALDELIQRTRQVKVLGCYPSDHLPSGGRSG